MYFGCFFCKHYRDQGGTFCEAFPQSSPPLPIAGGDLFHTVPFPGQKNDLVYETREGFKFELILKNRDRFPDAVFFEQKDYKIIGSYGGKTLILVGHEDEVDDLVVSATTFDFEAGFQEVHIVSLSSLFTMNPGGVRLHNYYPKFN